MQLRKVALCVESWWSEENHFTWNFARKRILQTEHSSHSVDKVYIIHVNSSSNRGKDLGDAWDKGTAILGDVRSELASYDHSIIELEGDPVHSIIKFVQEKGIHITILSHKDQNRVKRRMLSDSVHHILSKVHCACIIVSPRFSAGDHFRMKAKRQPDALVANSAMQYRRRVLILLNTAVWDSALTQYAASNVILSGDLVILVRCVHETNDRKNGEHLQTERDNMRELGWHKFRKSNISLAVEVIKNNSRSLCEFIASKGIDLLIMTRSDSKKIKIPIKKDSLLSQTFHERCPCPFMFVPSEILKSFSSVLPVHVQYSPFHKRMGSSPRSPFLLSLGDRIRRRGNFSRFSVLGHTPFKPFGQSRRCQSMDSTDKQQELHPLEYFRSDNLEYSPEAVAGEGARMEMKEFQVQWKEIEKIENSPLSSTVSPTTSDENLFDFEDKNLDVLKHDLSEKEQKVHVQS